MYVFILRSFLMKKFGFTLAEVLITLGIIGVVAALTLPGLVSNTNNKQMGVALSKAFNTLSRANTHIIHDNEFRSLSDLTRDQYITLLTEYLDCTFDQSTSTITGKDGISFEFDELKNDGNKAGSRKYTGLYYTVGIDVNANKNPNSSNIDRFAVYVDTSGIVIPAGGIEANKYNSSKIASCKKNDPVLTSSGTFGICTNDIVESGWQVDYVTQPSKAVTHNYAILLNLRRQFNHEDVEEKEARI
jgi:prepilin-type N-terminal cleavage/methylation domain-containing protein